MTDFTRDEQANKTLPKEGGAGLPTSIEALSDTEETKEGVGGLSNLSTKKMRAIIDRLNGVGFASYSYDVVVTFYDEVNEIFVESGTVINVPMTGVQTDAGMRDAVMSAILDYANNTQSYGITSADVFGVFIPLP